MTEDEQILILRTGLESADRKLELILGEPPPRVSEWHYTVALGVRRIIRNALKNAKLEPTADCRGTKNGTRRAVAPPIQCAASLADGIPYGKGAK